MPDSSFFVLDMLFRLIFYISVTDVMIFVFYTLVCAEIFVTVLLCICGMLTLTSHGVFFALLIVLV